jgi:hypothetical protein
VAAASGAAGRAEAVVRPTAATSRSREILFTRARH